MAAKEALAAGPTSAVPSSSSAKQMETTPDGKRKSSEDIKQEKYGNDNSEKSAAMQARLKASNPDAFKGEGFKVKFWGVPAVSRVAPTTTIPFVSLFLSLRNSDKDEDPQLRAKRQKKM